MQEIDIERGRLIVGHGFDTHSHALEFDQIVLSLGSTTQFFGLPGVEQYALTMKSLSDAVKLRNRLIALLEAADTECSQEERRELLSVAVAGAGFAGVETLASINDFLRNSLQFYPNHPPGQKSRHVHAEDTRYAGPMSDGCELWRTIYLSKLPRLEKKIRVALDWTLDLLFSKDLCQFMDVRQEHKMSNDAVRHLQKPARRQDAAPEQPIPASATL